MGQRSLPGARPAADENESDICGSKVVESDIDVSLRVGPGVRMALCDPDAVDLGSYHRAVSNVEVFQRRRR